MNCGHGGCYETIYRRKTEMFFFFITRSLVYSTNAPISTRDGVFDCRMSLSIIRNGVSIALYSQHSSETVFSVAKYNHLSRRFRLHHLSLETAFSIRNRVFTYKI